MTHYVYLHYFAPAQSTVTVPDNLIGDPATEEESDTPEDDTSPDQSDPDAEQADTSERGSTEPGQPAIIQTAQSPLAKRIIPPPRRWSFIRASRTSTKDLKR